jgi:hypothetical protein
MLKKYISFGVGIALLASPLLVSAQTVSVSSNASLIAVLTQLVQVLEQELQQLIAAQRGTTLAPSAAILPPPTGGSSPSQTNPSYQSSTQPSATIDQSSLTTTSLAPTITGTATGVSQLYVVVYNSSDKVWGSGNTDVNVVNGRWSVQIGAPVSSFVLAPGIYTVKVYVWPGDALLSSGTLTVTGSNSTQPSATISQGLSPVQATADPSSSGYFLLPGFSGTAANVSSVDVVAINGSYNGPTDFASAARIGQSEQSTMANPMQILLRNNPVSNRQWKTGGIEFTQQPPPTLTVLVYDNSSASSLLAEQPLARTMVQINAPNN